MNAILNYLYANCEDDIKTLAPIHPNGNSWTIADLFIRQYLNNGCDGFGMNNVGQVYKFLQDHREECIHLDLISEKGWSNSGGSLWQNYNY